MRKSISSMLCTAGLETSNSFATFLEATSSRMPLSAYTASRQRSWVTVSFMDVPPANVNGRTRSSAGNPRRSRPFRCGDP